MKIIHKNGFTKEELLAYRLGIFRNIVDTIKDIIKGVHKMGLRFAQPGNEVMAIRFYDAVIIFLPNVRLGLY
jgi:guanine nucleotide-binding protein subunit alpha